MNTLNHERNPDSCIDKSPALREFLRTNTIAERLRALRTPSIPRFLFAVLFNYSLIALAITLSVASSTWVFSGAFSGIVLIAARQHALLVLMHEGAHRNISKNRDLNDLLSDLLCGAPLLVGTRSYRKAHLTHHQHLNTAEDPDWCRKVDNPTARHQWLFPTQLPLWRLLANLYSHSVLYLLKTLVDNKRAEPSSTGSTTSTTSPTPSKGLQDSTLAKIKYLFYAAAGVVLTLTSSWTGLLIYWLVPMLLVLPLIMRVRSIAEHFALTHDHPLRQTRTVRAGWLERLLIAPHHIGLHIDHHLAASVPFYQLPRLHSLLLECPDYTNNAHLNDGYFILRGGNSSLAAPGPSRALFSADLYGSPSIALQPADAAQSTSTHPVTG